jgi:hypothetical protein
VSFGCLQVCFFFFFTAITNDGFIFSASLTFFSNHAASVALLRQALIDERYALALNVASEMSFSNVKKRTSLVLSEDAVLHVLHAEGVDDIEEGMIFQSGANGTAAGAGAGAVSSLGISVNGVNPAISAAGLSNAGGSVRLPPKATQRRAEAINSLFLMALSAKQESVVIAMIEKGFPSDVNAPIYGRAGPPESTIPATSAWTNPAPQNSDVTKSPGSASSPSKTKKKSFMQRLSGQGKEGKDNAKDSAKEDALDKGDLQKKYFVCPSYFIVAVALGLLNVAKCMIKVTDAFCILCRPWFLSVESYPHSFTCPFILGFVFLFCRKTRTLIKGGTGSLRCIWQLATGVLGMLQFPSCCWTWARILRLAFRWSLCRICRGCASVAKGHCWPT